MAEVVGAEAGACTGAAAAGVGAVAGTGCWRCCHQYQPPALIAAKTRMVSRPDADLFMVVDDADDMSPRVVVVSLGVGFSC